MEASGARGWTRLDRHPPPCAFLTQAPIPMEVFWSSARSDTQRPPLRSVLLHLPTTLPAAGESGILLVRALAPVSRQWSGTRTGHVPTDGSPTTAACRIGWRAVMSAAIASTRVHGRRVCLTG
ncbi:hypothetical protein J3F84DRAFT_371254 [Trichoderma pleuroticola]